MRARWLCAVLVASCASTFLSTQGNSEAGSSTRAVGARGGAFIPGPTPVRTPGRAPLFSVKGDTAAYSLNWSGYVQSSTKRGTFTSVTDTWKVPTVSTSPPGSQYSSDWVGIDGFANKKLVQAGTEGDNIDGTATYYAWTEILPASEVLLPMTIHAGDSITTVVKETSPNTWSMEVTDNATHATQGRTVSYVTPGKSVDAIHEQTSICNRRCVLDGLATTSNATFDPGSYTSTLQPSHQPLLVPAVSKQKTTKKGTTTTYATVYDVVMVNSGGTPIATPSAPDSDNDGFTVADGALAPPPPSS